jgi:NAD(P)-dependent dehydrogenase (short-subunit alcohol dehydrogenase family)
MSEEGTEAYSASKGGISSLTHALAMSLSPEIKVKLYNSWLGKY